MTKYRIIHQSTGVELPEGEFLIGRSIKCHLVIDDPSVSRVHAAVVRKDDEVRLVDKGSRNGLKVNGKLVDGQQLLGDGDRIEVGRQMVRIVSTERIREANKTSSMKKCDDCGAWLSPNERTCPKCGVSRDGDEGLDNTSLPSLQGRGSFVESQPIAMMARLAIKSIRLSRLDEATRLINNTLQIVMARVTAQGIEEEDFSAITEALLELANANKSSLQISQLFGLHRVADRLFSRETLETLFELVRVVDYRACNEMYRYLSSQKTKVDTFSPGEKFIYRRIEGLLKICS